MLMCVVYYKYNITLYNLILENMEGLLHFFFEMEEGLLYVCILLSRYNNFLL